MVIRMTKEIRHFSKNKNLHLILSIIMTVLSAFIQVYVIQVFMNPVIYCLVDLPELRY